MSGLGAELQPPQGSSQFPQSLVPENTGPVTQTQEEIVGFGWGRGGRQRRMVGGSFKRQDDFVDGALWNARVAAAAAAVPSYMYSSSPGEKLSEQVNNHI